MQGGLPIWLNARTIALFLAMLLVYGSLLPFEFHLETTIEQANSPVGWLIGILTAPRWYWHGDTAHIGIIPSAWLVDLAVNLLLYTPLGIALRLDLDRHGRSLARKLLTIALTLGFISYLVECAQGLMLTRVPSLIDVLCNTAGGIVGACFAKPVAGLFTNVAGWAYHLGFVPLARSTWSRALVAGLAVIVATGLLSQAVVPRGAWLPFAGFQPMPYDVAFLRLGELMTGYLLLAVALAFAVGAMPVRRRVAWLFAAQITFSLWRITVSGLRGAGNLDFTEPVIAVLAVGTLIVMAHIAVNGGHARRWPYPADPKGAAPHSAAPAMVICLRGRRSGSHPRGRFRASGQDVEALAGGSMGVELVSHLGGLLQQRHRRLALCFGDRLRFGEHRHLNLGVQRGVGGDGADAAHAGCIGRAGRAA